jgi:hypothetical protein
MQDELVLLGPRPRGAALVVAIPELISRLRGTLMHLDQHVDSDLDAAAPTACYGQRLSEISGNHAARRY